MSKQIHKAYKFRIYPNEGQKVFFAKSFGCARFIWNRMLADKKAYYRLHKKMLKNTPAEYKKEFEWLKEVDSLALANAQIQLSQAFFNTFSNDLRWAFQNSKTKAKKTATAPIIKKAP